MYKPAVANGRPSRGELETIIKQRQNGAFTMTTKACVMQVISALNLSEKMLRIRQGPTVIAVWSPDGSPSCVASHLVSRRSEAEPGKQTRGVTVALGSVLSQETSLI